MKQLVKFVSLSFACLLSACGGGSSSDSSPPGPLAEGVYKGYLTPSGESRMRLIAVVMANGETTEFWGAYYEKVIETPATSVFVGPVFGTGAIVDKTYTSADAVDFTDSSIAPDNISIESSSATGFRGTFGVGSNADALSGNLWNDSSFRYNRQADLAEVAGTWQVSYRYQPAPINPDQPADPVVKQITLNIENGTITGNEAGDPDACTYSGTIAPRGTEMNVFGVAITPTGAGCVLPTTGALSGVGLVTTGDSLLVLMVKDADAISGNVLTGKRP